jgi:hypothetical protein
MAGNDLSRFIPGFLKDSPEKEASAEEMTKFAEELQQKEPGKMVLVPPNASVAQVNAVLDMVNNPPHYGGQDNPYEVIKVLEAWGLDSNAYLFNTIKYIARSDKKGNPIEDLKKAQWYLNREITRREAAIKPQE